MDPYIGKFLDNRYELLELIGTGGMSRVYKARCHRLNRLVAVKILKSDLAGDAELRRRFHDESQAVAMLSHPNIVAVYDVSRSNELEYIVMELIDGITLKQYIQRKGVLNWREALHFILQIMKALSHAHSRGIIHRDIKPHNIMVLRDGSVKVADFGIARFTASQNTLTQEAFGSVHYISPEQAKGSRIDARADIYSAGVVLYEMLCGRLPFEGDSPVSVAIQHINSLPLSPRDINPDIPPALEEITLKAMAPDMEKRYRSADAMLADLEEFRKNPAITFDYKTSDFLISDEPDEPTRVLPVMPLPRVVPPEPSAKKARKRRKGRQGKDMIPEAVPESERGQEKNQGMLVGVAAILIFLAGVSYFLWTFFFSTFFVPTESYEVPDLKGQLLSEVMSNTEYTDKFEIVERNTVTSDEYEAGEIVDQYPVAGSTRKQGGRIQVDVSTGTKSSTMIDVVNMEYRTALAALDNSGIENRENEYEHSDTVTKNYVIRTDPEEGDAIAEDDTVTLVISLGPDVKTTTMISLLNKTESEARTMLEDLMLVCDGVDYVTSDVAEGLVVGQSVEAGTVIEEGSGVTIQVSAGPDQASPSPSSSPSPSPSPSVSPSPSPSPSSEEKTITYNVDLPSGTGVVHVKVVLGNTTVYEQTVDRSLGSIPVQLTGSGTKQLSIYYDGERTISKIVSFDD